MKYMTPLDLKSDNRVSFRGGGGGEHSPPLGSWLPPLERPTSYSITFDIVHVESFPLLMAKAVLNECFALLIFALHAGENNLSLLVFYSFAICLPVYMYRHLAYIV